jgi:hypothetical protein
MKKIFVIVLLTAILGTVSIVPVTAVNPGSGIVQGATVAVEITNPADGSTVTVPTGDITVEGQVTLTNFAIPGFPEYDDDVPTIKGLVLTLTPSVGVPTIIDLIAGGYFDALTNTFSLPLTVGLDSNLITVTLDADGIRPDLSPEHSITVTADITVIGVDEPHEDGGVGTPGYWKNHPEAWPVGEIEIGGITYTMDEALAIMNQPQKNDKTITMFDALVAAKLNVLIGSDDSCIADTITQAYQWMVDNDPVGSGVRANSDAWKSSGESLYTTLDMYNNGMLCAPAMD